MAEDVYPYEVGDLLEIVRNKMYSHWTIYKGNGEVYHLTFDVSKCNTATEYVERFLTKSVVRCDKLKDVAGKCKVVVSNKLDSKLKARVKEEIIKEIEEKLLGKTVYNIMFRNCESFVNMCRYGNPVSLQIVFVLKILLALTIGYIARKITIKFLEEKFKMKWAAVQVTGLVTGAAVVVLMLTVQCVEDFVVSAVTQASFICCNNTCAVAANFIIANCICAAIVKVVTSEPFKKIFKYSAEKMKQFFSALYNLVHRTISRILQKE